MRKGSNLSARVPRVHTGGASIAKASHLSAPTMYPNAKGFVPFCKSATGTHRGRHNCKGFAPRQEASHHWPESPKGSNQIIHCLTSGDKRKKASHQWHKSPKGSNHSLCPKASNRAHRVRTKATKTQRVQHARPRSLWQIKAKGLGVKGSVPWQFCFVPCEGKENISFGRTKKTC